VEKVRKVTDVPLMLTGGFRTLEGMEAALNSGAMDIVGIARPFAVYPELPELVLSGSKKSFDVENGKTGVKAVDGFMSLIWYEAQIKRLGEGKVPKINLSAWSVFFWYLRKMIRKSFNKN
jgi:imidazole glycerol phosphate synthase subunit HisF